MKVTAILKDFSECFYEGREESGIPAFLHVSPAEQWAIVKRLSAEKRVSMKINLGQFRDAVELNSMMRSPCNITCKVEPRRGYKLATFDITAA